MGSALGMHKVPMNRKKFDPLEIFLLVLSLALFFFGYNMAKNISYVFAFENYPYSHFLNGAIANFAGGFILLLIVLAIRESRSD